MAPATKQLLALAGANIPRSERGEAPGDDALHPIKQLIEAHGPAMVLVGEAAQQSRRTAVPGSS